MIGNPPTNFSFLQRDNGDVILDVREGDSTSRASTMYAQRKTLLLVDGSKLFVHERLEKNRIDFYQYDWVTANDKSILKFHSEPHEDVDYQTATEPHHIHPPEAAKLTNKDRLANRYHQDLFSIIEFIRLHILAKSVT